MPSEKKLVPGPEAFPRGEGATDADAESEAAAIAAGNLEEVSQRKEHGRRERFRDHAAIGAIAIFWLVILATCLSIVALAIHFLTPWGWLDPNQLTALKTYVFSGAVVAAITGYIRKYLH